MLRSCTLALVALTVTATGYLTTPATASSEGETTGTQPVVAAPLPDSRSEDSPTTHSIVSPLPMSREERIRAHRAKIEQTVRENREKMQSEMQAQAAADSSTQAPSLSVRTFNGVTLRPALPLVVSVDDLQSSKPLATETSGVSDLKLDLPSTATVSLAFSGAPIERILDSIQRQSGISVFAGGRAGGRKVSVLVRDEPVEAALNKLVLEQPDLILYRPSGENSTFEIWDQATFREVILPRFAKRQVFDIQHIAMSEAKEAVEPLLTQGTGQAIAISTNRKLIVIDLPAVLVEVERLLKEVDKAPVKAAP